MIAADRGRGKGETGRDRGIGRETEGIAPDRAIVPETESIIIGIALETGIDPRARALGTDGAINDDRAIGLLAIDRDRRL